MRRHAFPDSDTYRVVHGEADLLPGLVVDRYGDCLSVQLLVQATEKRKELIADLLQAHFRPRAIVNRSDVDVRQLEGLAPEKGLLRGEAPGPVPYRVGAVTYQIDLLAGQNRARPVDVEQQLEAEPGRRVGAGPEGLGRLDRDVDQAGGGRRLPGGADPQTVTDSDRLMEVAPALGPVVGDGGGLRSRTTGPRTARTASQAGAASSQRR